MSLSTIDAASCLSIARRILVNSVIGASSKLVRASHKSSIASVGLGLDAKKLSCLQQK